MQISGLFSDHMVIQRKEPVPVSGRSQPGDKITVRLAGQTRATVADDAGRWRVDLDPLPACAEPVQLVAESEMEKTRVTISDVLVGDVWLASGQSNMWWHLSNSFDAAKEIASASHPLVRLCTVPNRAKLGTAQEIDLSWHVCSPSSARSFSAVAYHFASMLKNELDVPVGIINSSWGGTRIEAWTSRAALMSDPASLLEIQEAEQGPLDSLERTDWLEYANDSVAWERRRVPADPGNVGFEKGWASPAFDDTDWAAMEVPCKWQDNGHNYSGVFWFRRVVEVPEGWAGKDLFLNLGACDKQDTTYFNNTEVGGIGWEVPDAWCTQRVYRIPGHLVRAGRNVIATRIYSYMTDGGLIGPSDGMTIAPEGAVDQPSVSLAGTWHYAVEHQFGVVTPPQRPFGPNNPNTPCILFESMIRPLTSNRIRGVIWYQGESNAEKAAAYRNLFPLMIQDWRSAFGKPGLPFLFVQLANYFSLQEEPVENSAWAELREAQALALQLPGTAMAVAIDVGDATDIHPRNKREVGRRLALAALGQVYGRPVESSGPLFKCHHIEEDSIRLFFSHSMHGLKSADGNPLRAFAIAGEDGRFVRAEARIEGGTVVVRSDLVPEPVSVRYAWANNPPANLANHAGLPASPFRTDAEFQIPAMGLVSPSSGFRALDACSDGGFRPGRDGVKSILATGDGKVEFISFAERTIAYVKSSMGYPAYYPVHPVSLEMPVKGVLMDLDGTTVRSEEFWIWIIEKTTASLLGDDGFELDESDLPYVSGHSVSEHLKYCLKKYCPDKSVEEAREHYFRHTHHEMDEILKGRGRKGAFRPTPGIKEFLLELKAMKVKLGLVTSGLYEKAYPEILSAFETLGMGEPKDFYDCIITAGFPLRRGEVGTLGELAPKPHPWLYSEACRVGLGIEFAERNHVVGIEDSAAGVCSIRLAGYPTIGIGGGNIISGGTQALCCHYYESFDEILAILKS